MKPDLKIRILALPGRLDSRNLPRVSVAACGSVGPGAAPSRLMSCPVAPSIGRPVASSYTTLATTPPPGGGAATTRTSAASLAVSSAKSVARASTWRAVPGGVSGATWKSVSYGA